MEHTQCSETFSFKLQTPGNHPVEGIRLFMDVCCKQNTNHSPQTSEGKQLPVFFTDPTQSDVADSLSLFTTPVLPQATAAVLPDVTCLVHTSGALYSPSPGF
jgi:hypothetical protein